MKLRQRSSALETGGSAMCCGFCFCSKRAKALACFVLWLPFVILAAIVIALLVNTALVSELHQRQELFPGRFPRLLDLSREDISAQAGRLAGAISIQTGIPRFPPHGGNYSSGRVDPIHDVPI